MIKKIVAIILSRFFQVACIISKQDVVKILSRLTDKILATFLTIQIVRYNQENYGYNLVKNLARFFQVPCIISSNIWSSLIQDLLTRFPPYSFKCLTPYVGVLNHLLSEVLKLDTVPRAFKIIRRITGIRGSVIEHLG